MNMTLTRPRLIAIALTGVIVAAAIVLGVYAFRDRLRPTPEAGAASQPDLTAGGSAAVVPRAEVSIDPQRQQLTGVRVAPVERGSTTASVRTTGVVRYDETRLVDVNLKLDGWIRELHVDYTGQLIQKGQPLFTLYSPDLLATQQEYLLALKTRDQVAGSSIADAREYADRVVEAARRRLTLWDLSSEDLASLDDTRRARDAITFRSPAGGYVIEKQALQGMHVTAGQTLYKVADLSSVWIEADVYEQEIALARVGQRATVTLNAYPDESFDGRAIYIYPFVEVNTRTVKVRFSFPNPRGRLKPGMFANVALQDAGATGLTVPSNAVLDSGTQQVVFVAQGDGVFVPRSVKAGRRLGDRIEILDGVKEGEQVATAATFFIDSESQLRAGLQNYEAAPGVDDGRSQSTGPAADSVRRLDISFRPQPDPPTTGASVFEVVVKDPAGQPVTDADVSVQLFMPAMPTMNMPAMRNGTKVPHVGAGVYRGPGQVLMGGHWDVTVTVDKGGQRLGRQQFSLSAK